MSIFDEIGKIITEHGSANILKERLALAADQYAALERKVALLTVELADAQRKIGHLETENTKLRDKLQHLQPAAQPVSTEELAILKFLETTDRNWPARLVAESLGTDLGRTHYLLTKLHAGKYVYEVPTGFYIEDKGRAALHSPSRP